MYLKQRKRARAVVLSDNLEFQNSESLLTVTKGDCIIRAPETRQTPALLQVTLIWLGI